MTHKPLTDPEKQYERAIKLTEQMLGHLTSYHDHKENMAHAILLVQFAFFGALAGTNNWPPDWIPFDGVAEKWMACGCVLVVWVLSYLMLRWQLIMRRIAAVRHAGLQNTYRDWCLTPPDPEELLTPTDDIESENLSILYVCLPPRRELPTVSPDLPDTNIPAGMLNRINIQRKAGTDALKAEWLVTVGSYIVLLGLMVMTFPDESIISLLESFAAPTK